MRSSKHAPSLTSLPRAPRDEAGTRVRNYIITMVIRIACFLLMLLVTPYGWYTWVFGAAAVFLPYIAVVYANASNARTQESVESPVLEISGSVEPEKTSSLDPQTITIEEKPRSGRDIATPVDPDESRS